MDFTFTTDSNVSLDEAIEYLGHIARTRKVEELEKSIEMIYDAIAKRVTTKIQPEYRQSLLLNAQEIGIKPECYYFANRIFGVRGAKEASSSEAK